MVYTVPLQKAYVSYKPTRIHSAEEHVVALLQVHWVVRADDVEVDKVYV